MFGDEGLTGFINRHMAIETIRSEPIQNKENETEPMRQCLNQSPKENLPAVMRFSVSLP
jgi:hypothetical protein